MINKILWNLINTGEVISFIDDVIVGTEEEEGYDKVVEEVVKRLAENNLYMKLEKSKQKVREIVFLEVVIRLEEIKIEKEKVKGVLDWPIPKEVKNIQKFLGLINYYQQFIQDFTAIAKPLHNLVKKNQKWYWIEKQEKVFKELKEKLVVPNLDKKMRMEVDISDYATRGVLSMEYNDG